MRQSGLSSFAATSFACLGLLLATPAAADPVPRPVGLELDSSGGGSRLWVEIAGSDAGLRRRLVRESASTIVPGRTGTDPAGRAAFATWSEDGEAWSAYSLDGGSTWRGARPLRVELRLRDGAVRPGAPLPPVAAGLALPPAGRVFLVQLRTISLPAWRAALEDAGAEVLAFFPHNAHLVRVAPERRRAVAALEFVARVEPFHPAYRLERELRQWLETPGAAPARIRVRALAFESGLAGKRRIAAAAAESGAEVMTMWPHGHIVELVVDRDQLRAIAAHDDVLWIDRWSAPENDMDLVREDAGTNWTETNFGYCGQGVRDEVLDSGIQQDHPDFDGLSGTGSVLLHGPHDVESHGTSTYGIVFGNGDRDGDGDPQALGHLPCAEQGIFADYETLGDRFAHTQELKAAPYFAAFQTNSWGDARTFSYNSSSFEMDDIIWRLDIAILQSQSNAGNQDSRPQAWAKNIISVGGIQHQNTLDPADDEWNFSASIGPAEDGRIKPDVSYWYDSIFTTTTGSGYTSGFGGTSAATPESAGVLGLLAQMWADDVWGTDPQGTTVFEKLPHFSTLKALLINSAEQYPFSGTGDDLTRVHQGWGRPNARNALERAARSFIVDEQVVLDLTFPLASYDVDVLEGEAELKVTMVYPDPPGTTAAALHRINDLDLRVISPSNVTYHGNVGLDAAPESAPGGGPNGVDTVENVFVVNPEAGLWRVEVELVELNQDAYLDTAEDDAAFALVVTGGTGSICVQPLVDFTITPNPARVGEEIRFVSTVTGGAGEPYTYRWDFEKDGVTDSTESDPVHIYRRPHDGLAKLRVRDVEGCPSSAEHAVTITGPDLRFVEVLDLVEFDGNANGAVDPGEVWDFRIKLRNDGNEPAAGVSARIQPSAGNAGSLLVLAPFSTFPDIAVGAEQTSDAFFRFRAGDDFTCGQDATFDVVQIDSADPGNRYPAATAAARVLVGGSGPPVPFLLEGWESGQNGWSAIGGGEWEYEPPQGLGGQQKIPGQTPGPDPAAALAGSNVMGTDLSGAGMALGGYESDVSTTVTSPPLDASDAIDVELRYSHWLNLDNGDTARVEVTGGVSWNPLVSFTGPHIQQAWVQESHDISAIADRNGDVRVRFVLESDAGLEQGGWNVDAFELHGVTKDSCEPFAQTAPGEAIGLQVDKDVSGDLLLSWAGDCGSGTTFAVYRGDLAAGYGSIAQEPGQCAVAGTSAVIPLGAGAGDFFVVVPNDGAFEGSYGAGSDAVPRAAAAPACLPQAAPAPCAP